MRQVARWSAAWSLGLMLATACGIPMASAEEGLIDAMLHKLGRGAANTLLGVTDVPAGIDEVRANHGTTAAWTWGPLVGLHGFVRRTLIGIVDVVTFPIPMPGVGYGPFIQPEFPYAMTTWGKWRDTE